MKTDIEPKSVDIRVKAGEQTLQTKPPLTGREKWHLVMRRSALFFLGMIVITLPWRLRLTLSSRPEPPVFSDYTDLNLYAHDLMLVALLVFWAISHLLKPRRLQFDPLFMWGSMVGLMTAATASVISSVDKLLSSYVLVHLSLALLLYLFVVNEVRRLRPLIWALSVQVCVQGVVSLGQSWLQHDLGLSQLGELDLDPFGGSAFVWAEGGQRALRAYGLSDHPNILAINLVLAMGILATWCIASKGKRRILVLATIYLAAVALLLTFSRPAWIAAVGGGMVGAALYIRTHHSVRIRTWIVVAGATMAITMPFAAHYMPFVSMGTNSATITARVHERLDTLEQRRTLDISANALFNGSALTGVGLGTMPLAQRQSYTDFPYDYQPARKTILNVAAEIGLLGALAYAALVTGPWIALLLWHRRPRFSPKLIGLSGVLLAITLFNFLDAYAWSYRSGLVWQWLLWGLWATSFAEARREQV